MPLLQSTSVPGRQRQTLQIISNGSMLAAPSNISCKELHVIGTEHSMTPRTNHATVRFNNTLALHTMRLLRPILLLFF
jgi:hypothetical protein